MGLNQRHISLHLQWCLVIGLVLFCRKGDTLLAQNLIPNPGFEDTMTPEEFQWVQPQGPFYHYEKTNSVGNDGAHSGRYVNGLCMYNHEANEYLHVKLREPLEAGQRYVFTLHARLYTIKASNYELHHYIGVHFGNKRLDTHVPGDLNFNPQLHMRLPDSGRFAWFVLRDTLEAKGGEQFLTMGYFPQTQRKEYDEKLVADFMDDMERMHAAQQRKAGQDPAEKSILYMSPAEQQKALKEKKKAARKHRFKKGAPPSRSIAPIEEGYRPPSGNAGPVPVHASIRPDGLFTVRYYFDDFCLAPLLDGASRCDEEPTEEMALELKTGATISLPNIFFALDKDVLLPESVVQLEGLHAVLLQHPKVVIEIRGHTDALGGEVYNKDLSKRRAAAVVSWLEARGIKSERLSSKGFGAAVPIASNEDEAGRARNRRVEFYVVAGL